MTAFLLDGSFYARLENSSYVKQNFKWLYAVCITRTFSIFLYLFNNFTMGAAELIAVSQHVSGSVLNSGYVHDVSCVSHTSLVSQNYSTRWVG